MIKTKAFLFLNGKTPSVATLKKIKKTLLQEEVFVVCADGAFSHIIDYFLPDLIVGDFDSFCREKVPKAIKILELNKEKDYTDGHVAMKHILNMGIKDIVIFGGTGKREDHTLSNYSLLNLANNAGAKVKMDTGKYIIELATSNYQANTKKGKIISLVPYTDIVHILETRGLKYKICDKKLDKIHILGISNVAVDSSIEYKISSGSALVFLEK